MTDQERARAFLALWPPDALSDEGAAAVNGLVYLLAAVRQDERRVIVASLVARAESIDSKHEQRIAHRVGDTALALQLAAHAIERGEHADEARS